MITINISPPPARWSEKQKPCLTFTYGYCRVEVLAVFSATLLTQFISFFIIKEAVHHLLEGIDFRPDSMLPATVFGSSSILCDTFSSMICNAFFSMICRHGRRSTWNFGKCVFDI